MAAGAIDTRNHRLFQLVRDFAQSAGPTTPAIRYRTKPDEVHDMTLCAARALGARSLHLIVQAAAGVDSPELPMEVQTLVLPTPEVLASMRQQAGFPDDFGLY